MPTTIPGGEHGVTYYSDKPPPTGIDPKGWEAWMKGEAEARKKYELGEQEKARKKKFGESISTYDELIKGQHEKLLSSFRTGTETGVARSLEASNRAAALRAQRSGLGRGGLGGRAAALGEVRLRGQGQAQMGDFSTKLSLLESQQREAFIRGEFGFMHEMEKMVAEQNFEEKMMFLQAKLQRDQESRNAFWNLAASIGGAAGEAVSIYYGGGG